MDKLPSLYPAIATVLKDARNASGLSQQELADFSGLSRSYISFVECGERGISVTALYQISKALNVEGAELFRRIEVALEAELKRSLRLPENATDVLCKQYPSSPSKNF